MEEMQQITIDQWMSWKEDIREKLRESAGNFVYIGYRLKQIRDSGMYDGAGDIFEFALKEYGLSKSTVSRFIAINEKFSEGGNSLELKEEYRAIGSSKLAEMLTLTDEECSLITEKTTVAQIRELKSFSRQQNPEEGRQESEEPQEHAWMPLQKCIIEYFRGKKEMLDAAMEHIAQNDYKQASEIINPSGNTTCRKGIIFLVMNEYKDGVKYKTFGRDDITVMSWDDFIMEICEIFWPDYSIGINGYDALYRESEKETEKVEEMPEILNEDESVATSQQEGKEVERYVEKMEDKTSPENSNKENDDASEKPADKTESGNNEDGTGRGDGEENLKTDESREEPEIEEQSAAGMIINEELKNADSGNKQEKAICEEAYLEIEYLLKDMKKFYDSERWDELIERAEQVIQNVEKIKEQRRMSDGGWDRSTGKETGGEFRNPNRML